MRPFAPYCWLRGIARTVFARHHMSGHNYKVVTPENAPKGYLATVSCTTCNEGQSFWDRTHGS